MNAARFDRILRQVLVVPLFVLLVGAGFLLWQIRLTNATVSDIQGADERIEQTIYIEKLIVDQETGLRGYEITRDPAFLEPYRAAETKIVDRLKSRRALAGTDARRRAVSDLMTAYETWQMGFANPVIATIASGGDTSDVELNLSGKRQMDEIRARINELNTYSENRLAEYNENWKRRTRTLTVALICTAILLGLLIGIYMRRLLQEVSAAFRQSHQVLRARAEQAFQSEQKLRTTLQSIGDAVVTCDPAGRVQSMNPVAEQLTGWTEKEAHGQAIASVFHIVAESTREPIENPIERVRRLNRFVGLTDHTILVRRDGSELFIDDSGAPIRDKTGEMMGVVLVFRDVTMAKKSREALIATEKLAVAGRLAATIAHEIHNPLDSVSNLLFLMDGESTPEESVQFLALARQEITRVTQISRAMLSLYRESRAPVAIDLKDMLESILLLMERRFSSLGVAAEADLPPGLIVHGFPAELRQVFTNLLTNAAEASSPKAAEAAPQAGAAPIVVRVSASAYPAQFASDGLRREAGAVVSIEDHGPGIPEEIRESLFKPFFTTKGEQGTGLGLWVSQGIIGKHGGALELISSTDAERHGTTIEVYLAAEPVIHPAGD